MYKPWIIHTSLSAEETLEEFMKNLQKPENIQSNSADEILK